MSASAIVVLLVCCFAQDPTPAAPAPQPQAKVRVAPDLQRAIDGALAACQKLLATDHAFAGSVATHCGLDAGLGPAAEPASYRGATQGAVQLFALGTHRILTAGRKRLERAGAGGWTLPQGDAPDCPLAPAVFARHLPAATIDGWSASAHGDRPALRVHAVWKDKAAAAVIGELAMPDAKWDRLLESLAIMVKKPGSEQIVVDASIFFDPATKSLQGATLRVALMQPEAPGEGDEPAPSPAELPALSKSLWLQFVYEVSVLPAAQEPMPALDATMRERLGLPAK